MKVAVIGTGYVGLVTGLGLAELGHDVTCVDVDRARVESVTAGILPIFEAGLEEMLHRQLETGRFGATDDLPAAVGPAEVVLVAVGTPTTEEGIDLRFLEAAASEVGASLDTSSHYPVVVVKSTVVPTTTDRVVTPILEAASRGRVGADFGVGVNPEFLTEGTAVADFMEPDRIVIGGDGPRTLAVLRSLYAPFAGVETIETNNSTGEMIKYASNALLATMISFSNELANLGAALGGIDAVEVMRGVHASRYLTTRRPDGDVVAPIASFLLPGCGFGGSCLPKDVGALTQQARAAGSRLPVLEAVLEVNTGQPVLTVDSLERALGDLRGRRIAVLGLAFKPDTDDTRMSPAFPIIEHLHDRGADLIAHDPVVGLGELPPQLAELVRYEPDLGAAVTGVDAVLIVTRWGEYEQVPGLIEGRQQPPLVFDARRMLAKDSVSRYTGIGV